MGRKWLWIVIVLTAAAAVLGAASAARGFPAPIIGGEEADEGEYPAQGALFINVDNDPQYEGLCGGTLVGSRYFLTAAHCVDEGSGTPFSADRFLVVLGTNDISPPVPDANRYSVATVDENAAFDPDTFVNDTAMLKLALPAPYRPLRVIGKDEAAKWAPGTSARIIGWGTTTQGGGGSISTKLLEAEVPVVSDAQCLAAYPFDFDSTTMVCAYDGTHDTCQGDSGGPLMVPDGSGLVLAGITSWGVGCADAGFPGVYTRIGTQALNDWVMSRFPRASFTSGAAQAGQPVAFTSTSFHPEADGFTVFKWDFDGNGVFDDATGAAAAHTFPAPGVYSIGLEASKPGADRAETRRDVIVAAAQTPPPPPAAPPPAPPPPAPPPPVASPPAPPVVRCVVPRLRGRRLAGARAALARAHCRLGAVTRSYSTTVRAGRVMRQRPAAGTRRLRGTRVAVVVSRGKKKR